MKSPARGGTSGWSHAMLQKCPDNYTVAHFLLQTLHFTASLAVKCVVAGRPDLVSQLVEWCCAYFDNEGVKDWIEGQNNWVSYTGLIKSFILGNTG